jgi:hypothetical protein
MKAIFILGLRGDEIDRVYIHVIRFDRNGFVETLRTDNVPHLDPLTGDPEPHFSRTPLSLPKSR